MTVFPCGQKRQQSMSLVSKRLRAENRNPYPTNAYCETQVAIQRWVSPASNSSEEKLRPRLLIYSMWLNLRSLR